ncbi:hypothetical protein DPMN_174317 [Dreissena polymorpha]|uniref:Uncharacterized protein n=1 Tax=Dreissena polymorpha TaxID=45954 RepID=A0A9D4IH05_DREPO|nr:hypothetical protein DPMN_174317 [Dreissena polymorpha]
MEVSGGPKCQLCDKLGTMQHTLSSCQTTLTQGRYRWRHGTVHKELADILERERRKTRPTNKKALPTTKFVKEGQTAKKSRTAATAILAESIALGDEGRPRKTAGIQT